MEDWTYSDSDAELIDEAFCRKHGPSTVVKAGTFSGYAGGLCYFWKLACGCTLLDESDDVRVAE
jgi:hypothetical protein